MVSRSKSKTANTNPISPQNTDSVLGVADSDSPKLASGQVRINGVLKAFDGSDNP